MEETKTAFEECESLDATAKIHLLEKQSKKVDEKQNFFMSATESTKQILRNLLSTKNQGGPTDNNLTETSKPLSIITETQSNDSTSTTVFQNETSMNKTEAHTEDIRGTSQQSIRSLSEGIQQNNSRVVIRIPNDRNRFHLIKHILKKITPVRQAFGGKPNRSTMHNSQNAPVILLEDREVKSNIKLIHTIEKKPNQFVSSNSIAYNCAKIDDSQKRIIRKNSPKPKIKLETIKQEVEEDIRNGEVPGLPLLTIPNATAIQNDLQKTLNLASFRPVSPICCPEIKQESETSLKDTNNSNSVVSSPDVKSQNPRIQIIHTPDKSRPIVEVITVSHKTKSHIDGKDTSTKSREQPVAKNDEAEKTQRLPKYEQNKVDALKWLEDLNFNDYMSDLNEIHKSEVKSAISNNYNDDALEMIQNQDLYVWQLIEQIGKSE